MNRTAAALAVVILATLVAAAFLFGRQSGEREPQDSITAARPAGAEQAPEPEASVANREDGHAPQEAFTPAEKARIERWDALNSACRGGSGDDPDTWKACDARDALGPKLNSADLCYGREGESGAENTWHRCGPDSLRFPEKARP